MLLGFAASVGSAFVLVVGEAALLATAATVVVLGRYAVLRRRYLREREAHRRAAERQRIADDVHDLVGHDLGLIALRAGALQLRTAGADAQAAAEIRARAEQAVTALHDAVRLISGSTAGRPSTATPDGLIREFRDAGGEVAVAGEWGDLPATVGLTLTAVLREALTNAARHAPGRPVEVVRATGGSGDAPSSREVRMRVTTLGAGVPAVPAGEAGGLSAIRRRVQALGGTVAVRHVADGAAGGAGGHELSVRLPLDRVPALSGPGIDGAEDPEAPRPTRHLLVRAGSAVCVVAALLAGFYVWASTGASVEPAVQQRIRVGTPADQALDLLPGRQAPVRLLPAPGRPPGWDCRTYTDGNVPLAMATFEVCLTGGRVVRVTDLAARSPW